MNITTTALFAVLRQQQSHTDYSESQSTALGDQMSRVGSATRQL